MCVKLNQMCHSYVFQPKTNVHSLLHQVLSFNIMRKFLVFWSPRFILYKNYSHGHILGCRELWRLFLHFYWAKLKSKIWIVRFDEPFWSLGPFWSNASNKAILKLEWIFSDVVYLEWLYFHNTHQIDASTWRTN